MLWKGTLPLWSQVLVLRLRPSECLLQDFARQFRQWLCEALAKMNWRWSKVRGQVARQRSSGSWAFCSQSSRMEQAYHSNLAFFQLALLPLTFCSLRSSGSWQTFQSFWRHMIWWVTFQKPHSWSLCCRWWWSQLAITEMVLLSLLTFVLSFRKHFTFAFLLRKREKKRPLNWPAKPWDTWEICRQNPCPKQWGSTFFKNSRWVRKLFFLLLH